MVCSWLRPAQSLQEVLAWLSFHLILHLKEKSLALAHDLKPLPMIYKAEPKYVPTLPGGHLATLHMQVDYIPTLAMNIFS